MLPAVLGSPAEASWRPTIQSQGCSLLAPSQLRALPINTAQPSAPGALGAHHRQSLRHGYRRTGRRGRSAAAAGSCWAGSCRSRGLEEGWSAVEWSSGLGKRGARIHAWAARAQTPAVTTAAPSTSLHSNRHSPGTMTMSACCCTSDASSSSATRMSAGLDCCTQGGERRRLYMQHSWMPTDHNVAACNFASGWPRPCNNQVWRSINRHHISAPHVRLPGPR